MSIDEAIKYLEKYKDDEHYVTSCVEAHSLAIEALEKMKNPWILCSEGNMPENDSRYEGKEVINCLVTTKSGIVTKVQRIKQYCYDKETFRWKWGRIYEQPRSWMPLPEPYMKEADTK